MMLKFVQIPMVLSVLLSCSAWAQGFDHGRWDSLLKAHVIATEGGRVTMVDYQGMAQERQALKEYLAVVAKVSRAEFDQWPKNEQLAFLINAYNAWTIELILTAWPDLESIKDLGGLFSSPWSKAFVDLLGKTRSLDDVEHNLIRGSDRYDDPRIHFAVNCASIGCPALRAEAYVGERVNAQLDEQTALFLSDRSRNREEDGAIKLSMIFKWYRVDFTKGWLGFDSLQGFLLAHADALNLTPQMKMNLQKGDAEIEFLNYDWRLNKS